LLNHYVFRFRMISWGFSFPTADRRNPLAPIIGYLKTGGGQKYREMSKKSHNA